jgi:Alcohol dehydrogenase GroES-like domain
LAAVYVPSRALPERVRGERREAMKALVKEKPEPGLWLEEQPIPSIGPDDVLIEVYKTGICGTDVHIFDWDAWAKTLRCQPRGAPRRRWWRRASG